MEENKGISVGRTVFSEQVEVCAGNWQGFFEARQNEGLSDDRYTRSIVTAYARRIGEREPEKEPL